MPTLNESFSVADENHAWSTISDLNKLVPCVPGATVTSSDGPDSVEAEIEVKMGSMAMKFKGPVKMKEKDDASKTAKIRADTKEAGGQSNAAGDVTIKVSGGTCTINADANVSGKAASMGEGTIVAVLTQLVKQFAGNVGKA
jgi:carbon monoxide dehydrogenase subunit G